MILSAAFELKRRAWQEAEEARRSGYTTEVRDEEIPRDDLINGKPRRIRFVMLGTDDEQTDLDDVAKEHVTRVTTEQLVKDDTYETWIPTSADGAIIGDQLAARLPPPNRDGDDE